MLTAKLSLVIDLRNLCEYFVQNFYITFTTKFANSQHMCFTHDGKIEKNKRAF